MQRYFSHGKLLLSGEYLVLDGATALALPTQKGQSLEIRSIEDSVVRWRSMDHRGSQWLSAEFPVEDIPSYRAPGASFQGLSPEERLSTLLSLIAVAQPERFSSGGYEIRSTMDFPADWGLGSSSTLIANLSKWTGVDPYLLLKKTFGGSGYDIAVAMAGTAVTYQIRRETRSVLHTRFDPPFKQHLFFVHLNRKMDSRQAIAHYQLQPRKNLENAVEKASALTHRMITCSDLKEFQILLEIHENLISQVTGQQKVASRLFPDYSGTVKSLGGWGGDFLLATGSPEDQEYFRNKGYSTIIPYEEMIGP